MAKKMNSNGGCTARIFLIVFLAYVTWLIVKLGQICYF